MRVFIFRSGKDLYVIGYSQVSDGRNLPEEFAPWVSLGDGAIQRGQSLAGVGLADPAIDAIKREGFFVAKRGDVIVTRQTLP
ncbi:MAG: hypothetical protein JO320_13905 [Alphaproteobacteria bacterium]|nr:hypothetical protein [Alphaproteobacteria bacterium]